MLICSPGGTCKEIRVAMTMCKGPGLVGAAWEALRPVSVCPSHMGSVCLSLIFGAAIPFGSALRSQFLLRFKETFTNKFLFFTWILNAF